MAVKLRLTRHGRRHRPFFRINAVESRTPRDGRILEKLGHYDPIEKDKSKQIVLNNERVLFWLGQGAVPSETVSEILTKQGIKNAVAKERVLRRDKARAIARKKGQPFTKTEREAVKAAAEEAVKAAEAKKKEDAKKAEEAKKAAAEAKKAEEEAKKAEEAKPS
jgi:small subunit ribosomal protein S16